MNTMIDRDGVVRAVVDCIDNHASKAVRDAFAAWSTADEPAKRAFAEEQLRAALVAQAAGHDGYCGNGSTGAARQAAAKAALTAWDGPTDVVIVLGGVEVRCSKESALAAGWDHPYANSDVMRDEGHHRLNHDPRHPKHALYQALSEGLRGEAAVRRAIAIRQVDPNVAARITAAQMERDAAAENAKAAGMRLAAEREISKRTR